MLIRQTAVALKKKTLPKAAKQKKRTNVLPCLRNTTMKVKSMGKVNQPMTKRKKKKTTTRATRTTTRSGKARMKSISVPPCLTHTKWKEKTVISTKPPLLCMQLPIAATPIPALMMDHPLRCTPSHPRLASTPVSPNKPGPTWATVKLSPRTSPP